MEILWFLIIGAVSGWLGGQLWKGSGFGLIGNIIAGILGGVVGGWLAGQLGIFGTGLLGKILISAAGAWILLFILSLIKK
jgi:uncharacterized membrane protein YeaQ/YmgE (transglycosylase-associated protein family)